MRTCCRVAILLALAGCGTGSTAPTEVAPMDRVHEPLLASLPADCLQALVVRPVEGKTVDVTLTLYDRRTGVWVIDVEPFPGTVGRNGITPAEKKKEGDGCTPAGTYRIGTAFGYDSKCATRLAYRQATADDFWVDDPDSPDYNRWVTGKPKARSFERMKRDDDLYEFGAVIEYNTSPVVSGKGSAIFLHVWPGPGKPTAGCVATTRGHVGVLLISLDESWGPRIVIAESPSSSAQPAGR